MYAGDAVHAVLFVTNTDVAMMVLVAAAVVAVVMLLLLVVTSGSMNDLSDM